MDEFLAVGGDKLPKTEFDSDWISSCQQSNPDNQGFIEWRPEKIKDLIGFADVESALELQLHSDIKDYFSEFYSEAIDAKADKGNLQLLFAWNHDDFQRLQQNIIGHVLMKRRLSQPITVFFAVTDEDDWFLSLDNDSGKVLLETPGLEPETVIAESLAEFISSLKPVFPEAL